MKNWRVCCVVILGLVFVQSVLLSATTADVVGVNNNPNSTEIAVWAQKEIDGEFVGDAVFLEELNPGFLSAVLVTLINGFEWDVVELGDRLDANFLYSNTAFVDSKIMSFQHDFMPIVDGDPFFWGFWYDFDLNERVSPGDFIGWAELEFQEGELVVLRSYADDSGAGIVVGETTAIPLFDLLVELERSSDGETWEPILPGFQTAADSEVWFRTAVGPSGGPADEKGPSIKVDVPVGGGEYYVRLASSSDLENWFLDRTGNRTVTDKMFYRVQINPSVGP